MAALTPENPGGSFKSLFGRIFGLLGDDLGDRFIWAGGKNGKVIASTKLDIQTIVTGLNGAGAITLTGASVGDLVVSVLQVDNTPVDLSSSFETTISVANQIQQSSASNLSANHYLVRVLRQS